MVMTGQGNAVFHRRRPRCGQGRRLPSETVRMAHHDIEQPANDGPPAGGPDLGPESETAPGSPAELPKRSWWGVLKRTVKEFQEDNLTDWAAALTYYAVLSIFPALLAVISVLG